MRRRVLFTILAMVAVLALAEAAARATMTTTADTIRWYDAVAQLKIQQMEAPGESAELVFAGTSMAAQGFSPEIFTEETGQTAFNAALAGGTPEVMSPWLLDEVDERLDPDTVVWGLSGLDLSPSYGDDNGATYVGAPESRPGLLATLDRAASSVSSLVADRSTLRRLDALWGGEADQRRSQLDEAATYTSPSGQRIDYRAATSGQRAAVMRARLAAFAPSVSDIERIEATVRELTDRGIDVVLVEMPVPSRFVEQYPRGIHDHELVGPVLSRIAENTGVRFLSLTDGFTDEDFVDFSHLDTDGARRLTADLAGALAEDRDDVVPFPGPRAVDFEGPRGSACAETETIVDEYGNEVTICVD